VSPLRGFARKFLLSQRLRAGLMNDAAPRLEFCGCRFTDVAEIEIELSRTHLRHLGNCPPGRKCFTVG
jgi:hypothetical protein